MRSGPGFTVMTTTLEFRAMVADIPRAHELRPAILPRAVQFGLIGLVVALAILAWMITGDRMQAWTPVQAPNSATSAGSPASGS